MRKVVFDGSSQVRVVDAPEPSPGPGEVLIATAVSALCGSELKSYRGAGITGGNGGHEAAGTVIEVGPGVDRLRAGQRVGLSAIVGCGACAQCAAGRYTWCSQRRFIGNMHAERIVIPAHGCHPLPDDVDWAAGVLLSGDGLGVPFHTSMRLAHLAVETVAIFGAGPIGLGNTLLHSFLGRQVIAVDVAPYRLELARTLGAAHVVDAAHAAGLPAADPAARVREITGGRGADVCLEAAGRPETLRQCFAAVRTGGTVVMNGEQPAVELSPSEDFIRRDIAAFGAWYYHFGEFAGMLALEYGGLDVARLITHRYPLAEAAHAYQEFAAARTGKVLLSY